MSRFWPWPRRPRPALSEEAEEALAEIENAAAMLWPRCYGCGSDTIAMINVEGQVVGWMGAPPAAEESLDA